MKPDPTRNTRQSRHRSAAKAAGGAFVSTPIGQDAAHALDALRAQGLTVRQAVERALEATTKAPPRFEHRIADVGRIGENRGRLGAV